MVTHENYQHSEDLEHEPPVTGDARVVLQQLPLCATDVGSDVDRVCVYPLDGFPLLRHHLRKLREDLTEFCYGRFDGFYRGGTRLNIRIL